MPEMSPPKSTVISQSDLANEKLKEQQKAKVDEARFIQQLFVLMQMMQDLILKKEFFLLQTPLNELARDCGFQDLLSGLNQAKNTLGQTPLVQALQNQDFVSANALVMSGAKYDGPALAEYDLAIHSARGIEALHNNTIKPPAVYTPSAPDKLPSVKEYGLVLGIEMTSKDGTFSQRAAVGPTYRLMTNSIAEYSKECGKQPEKRDFQQIADAYKFSNEHAKFEHSNPKGNPKAAADLCERIQKGDVTSVPINCKGHAMGLSFAPVEGDPSKTYLIFTNRGEGAQRGKSGTHIYEVDKKDISPKFLEAMMSGHHKGQSHQQVMDQIHNVTKGKDPVASIAQKPQKYDNCTVANTRSNIQGILLCQEANRKRGFQHVDKEAVKERFKDFTSDMRRKKVEQLGKALKQDPHNEDLKALAKGYSEKPGGKFKDLLTTAARESPQESTKKRSP